MKTQYRTFGTLVVVFLLASGLSSCATVKHLLSPPDLVVTPDKTVLSPALLQKPIVITGSGWKPGELVVVNMAVPKGVKVKGAEEGEPVGIASGNADAQGNLKTTVEALTVLMTFFQTGWIEDKAKPDFSQATPLPPGIYPLEAIGTESALKARATLTLLPPPKK